MQNILKLSIHLVFLLLIKKKRYTLGWIGLLQPYGQFFPLDIFDKLASWKRVPPFFYLYFFFEGRSLWDLIFERKLFISGGGFQGKDFCAYSLYIYNHQIIDSRTKYFHNDTCDIFVLTMGKRLSFTFFIIKVNKIFKIIIIGNSIRWEAKWKTSTFVQEMKVLASYICIILWGPMNKYILQWKCGFGAWEETIMFSCNTSTKDHWLLLENHQNVNWISYSYIYITKRKWMK